MKSQAEIGYALEIIKLNRPKAVKKLYTLEKQFLLIFWLQYS